jgi:hypothetical protein
VVGSDVVVVAFAVIVVGAVVKEEMLSDSVSALVVVLVSAEVAVSVVVIKVVSDSACAVPVIAESALLTPFIPGRFYESFHLTILTLACHAKLAQPQDET